MRCGNSDSELYRTSGKCTVEHGFEHNSDLERFFVGSDNGRQLQRNGKHIRMQIQVQNQLQLEQFNFNMRCGNSDGELYRTSCKCTVEHRFKYNADLEWFFLGSVNDRNLQHIGKHIRMQIQVQNQLQLEQLDFDMCSSNSDSDLHRTSCKRTVEHRFEHNPDMERIIMGTGGDRQLQHDCKYDPVPLQM